MLSPRPKFGRLAWVLAAGMQITRERFLASWRRMANTRRVCGGLLACVGAAGLTWLILSVALGAGYDPTRGGVVATPASVLDAGVGRGAPGAGAVPAPRRVPSVPVPRVRAQAAIIFDPVTGETLWERNSRDLRSIASITKVMTVMLFLEQQPDLSREGTSDVRPQPTSAAANGSPCATSCTCRWSRPTTRRHGRLPACRRGARSDSSRG